MRHCIPTRIVHRSAILAIGLFCFSGGSIRAAVPTDPAQKTALIGQPTALQVQPEALTLLGPRAMQQLVITGRYADGSVRDLTAVSELSCDGGVAAVAPGGFVRPVKNGTGTLVIKAGSQTQRVPVTVKDLEKPQPVSFRHELIAALNVGGCNAGACHGTPSGKNGFRLSLRGFDPDADHEQLTHDVFARRTGSIQPDQSLLYLKGLGRVPHEGGQRYPLDSVAAVTLKQWLAEGLQKDRADLPQVESIQILPGSRVLKAPARLQQLAVLARFSDGSVRDMTRLTVFSSSDPAVAEVSPTGLVEFNQSGEVAILCRYLETLQTVRLTYLEPKPNLVWVDPPQVNYIDKHVFAKLKMLGLPPSELCNDQEFLRRISLDLLGVLPTPSEVQTFLASKDPAKREKLIDAMLQRPEYADFWTLKWMDVLRSNRKVIQAKGTHVFQHWLREHLVHNTDFDKVVRELLTADGSTYANPPANYYRIARDPQSLAETTAQLFFGIRMQCAKCHNHPFERWTQDDYYSLAAYFARVRLKKDPEQPGPAAKGPGAEVVYTARSGEVTQPRSGKTMVPRLPGQKALPPQPGQTRREQLAAVLTAKENPFFARATVNRVWFHLFGKGIVDPVDDFRDSNPSANDELLDALAADFVAHHYDLKYLIRTILSSRTYQLGSQTNAFNKDDEKYFSHAYRKLLPAEVLLDALCEATAVPEKFAGMPPGTRAVQLPDGDGNHTFLKTFGQPPRELACECERESDSNLAHALQLINGQTINGKLRDPNNRLGKLLKQNAPERAILNDLFLATLSRLPNEGEVKTALTHVGSAKDKRKAWEDVHWVLLNSKEFLFRR